MDLILIIEAEMTLSDKEDKNLDERSFILLYKEVHHFWNVVPQKLCIWQVGTVQTSNSLGQGVHRRSI